MTDEATLAAVDRINQAIARIEAAVTSQQQASAALHARHIALRTRVGEALDALDALVEDDD